MCLSSLALISGIALASGLLWVKKPECEFSD